MSSFLPAKSLYGDESLNSLMIRASEDEREALLLAIDEAYKKGQDDADARMAKLMTRIFSGFIGVTPGIDHIAPDGTPEGSRVRKIINLMRGS
jgi:hypothetical protein